MSNKEHKNNMRRLFYSLSDEGKRQLVEALKAQLRPDQERAVQILLHPSQTSDQLSP
jgi:DNA-binding PadR family transcriptional regulator